MTSARELIERSLELARQIQDPHREATALTNVVHIHMDLGDYDAAVEAARRAVAADSALGDPWGVAINQSNLVVALLHAQGPRPAFEALRGVLSDAVALEDVELAIDVIETSAAVWAGLGEPQRAATLLGSAQAQREAVGIPRARPNQTLLDRFVEPARASLPSPMWQRAADRGALLTLEDAASEALGNMPVAGAHPG